MIPFQAPLGCQRNGSHEVGRRRQTHLWAGRLLVEHLLLAVLRTVHDMVLTPTIKILVNKKTLKIKLFINVKNSKS